MALGVNSRERAKLFEKNLMICLSLMLCRQMPMFNTQSH